MRGWGRGLRRAIAGWYAARPVADVACQAVKHRSHYGWTHLDLLRHYTLSDDDIEQIRVRRGRHNRLGFALQLCAFRYPGRILTVGEAIPLTVLGFIAAQLGMGAEDLDGYAIREETRREHLAELRRIYGYRMFSGRCARNLKVWLEHEAEPASSNEGLARRFVEECRSRQVILPRLSCPDHRSWSVFARAHWLPQSAG